MRIGVVDYGVGNLRSVSNAFAAIGAPVELCATTAELSACDKLVLPGVGAFAPAMRQLEPLRAMLDRLVMQEKRPVLGLCLGMQLMADRSFEHGEHGGLGWIAGEVVALPAQIVGWNTLNILEPSRVVKGGTMYFVHGYHFVPKDRAVVTHEADGIVAAIERDNVFAVQFHPEKSQRDGLALLERFATC